MHINVICSWCNKFLHTKIVEDEMNGKTRISHSICDGCKKQVMREYKKSIKTYAPKRRVNL